MGSGFANKSGSAEPLTPTQDPGRAALLQPPPRLNQGDAMESSFREPWNRARRLAAFTRCGLGQSALRAEGFAGGTRVVSTRSAGPDQRTL